jgi:hypothetical protein
MELSVQALDGGIFIADHGPQEMRSTRMITFLRYWPWHVPHFSLPLSVPVPRARRAGIVPGIAAPSNIT